MCGMCGKVALETGAAAAQDDRDGERPRGERGGCSSRGLRSVTPFSVRPAPWGREPKHKGCDRMARIRTVKPEFWTDEKTGHLSSDAKLLFIGLWNHADDYGVLEWRPEEWRIKILPYDSRSTTVSILDPIAELMASGLCKTFDLTSTDGGDP